ncbi:WD40-repeat-containing domain protein [Baffinella frigidus]|nr:WD40-repeat-containing domain protein [Cryptophyta sp. CCMP2293]
MSGGLCKVFELSMTEGLSVLHILSGHTSVVCGCSFSADGARVATASLDHTLKVWDVQRGGKPLNSFTDPTEVRSCHFSPDGTFVAVALDSGLAEVLDIASGKTMMSFGRHSGRVNSVMFAPNGTPR